MYTSSVNVVYGGQEILDGDESLPYFPLERHTDAYSKTKAIAEQLVINANGRKNQRSGVLRTCALRPNGIFGEEEERHFSRLFAAAEMGLLFFKFSTSSKFQMVFVDNLVHAEVLAAQSLLSKERRASGRVYFITDGPNYNNFEFFEPLLDVMGLYKPRLVLPFWLIYFIAYVIEIVHSVVSPLCPFKPFLVRAEALKTGVTHVFSNNRAAVELKFDPPVPHPEGMQRVVEHYRVCC